MPAESQVSASENFGSWEGKHIPKPERIVCGERAYRRYTQAQINLITRIKEYQDQGFTLSAAAKKANDDLARKGGTIMRKKQSNMKTTMCPFFRRELSEIKVRNLQYSPGSM